MVIVIVVVFFVVHVVDVVGANDVMMNRRALFVFGALLVTLAVVLY